MRITDIRVKKVEIVYVENITEKNHPFNHYEVRCDGKETGRGNTIQEAIQDYDDLNKQLK